MTIKHLNARMDRLQPTGLRPMCVYFQPGDSEESIRRRVAAVGYPVVVVPRPCMTTQEWLALYGPKARHD
ncbi:MAG: hypothetical protein AB7F22_15100 [Reyranella sp.]|uniref:hypothetical protein n=1 Tax=Reyranella sp. TaxID=1929291 RepID=UPI003D1021AA